MIKILMSLAVTGLGIAGAVFIIQSSTQPLAAENQPTAAQNNNPVTNQPFVETLTLKNSDLGINNTIDKIKNSSTEENLTDLFTKEIGKTITENNPNGPTVIDGQKSLGVPDPDAITQDVLARAFQNFDPETLKPNIKESALRISQNNDVTSLTNYFKAFKQIIYESAALIPESVLKKELDSEAIEYLSKMYESAYKKLFLLTVPSELLVIHKKELQLLSAKLSVYRAIKNYEQDPLLSLVAAQNLKFLDQEFSDLDVEIAKFINSH